MALTNYTELKASVADWLNRGDLTSQVKDFISLAEAEIRRRLRRSRVRATVTFTAETFSLPATLGELTSVRLVTGSTSQDLPIEICTPEILAEHKSVLAATGRPRFAAVVGAQLLLAPVPNAPYSAEIMYFEKLVSLSDAFPTNTTLTESPDLYLFGALMQAEGFLVHDERITTWENKFEKALAQLQIVRDNEEYGASLRPMRLPVRIG